MQQDGVKLRNRPEQIVKQRGLNVFARIDHAAGAAKVGKFLRPTELLIFGNPQGGTPLMEVRRLRVSICRLRRLCGKMPPNRSGLDTTTRTISPNGMGSKIAPRLKICVKRWPESYGRPLLSSLAQFGSR
jgi:hypothetical protein